MRALYPADKHCALRHEAWSADRVQAGIREILQHSISSFDPRALWPRHPLDGDDPSRSDYYFGAGGVFWGVSLLSRAGWLEEPEGWFGACTALDALLLEAGQLIFEAGALRKGPSLCHGTAGNGFALLKLHQRTGDHSAPATSVSPCS